MPHISLQNIAKSFGTKHVLNDFNLTAQKGEVLSIIGQSGSGKSVLLKCILGLLTPDKGHVFIEGIETTHLSPNEREDINDRIGMVFQNGALFDSLTIWENVAFKFLQNKTISKKEAKEQAIQTLKEVGLPDSTAHQYPIELSGGMRKRVAIARAVIHKPDVILYDEPTTGLDPVISHTIDNLITQYSKEHDITSLVITHDIQSLKRISDHVAMLYQGKDIWYGTVKEMEASDHPYVTQFIQGKVEGPIKNL